MGRSNAVVTKTKRPYFGIIADSIHLHPTSIKIAHSTHPAGFILVTDAMSLLGLPDGTYPWTNNLHITKSGFKLTLANDPDKIAGSAVTLIECVNNFWNWAGVSVAEAVRGVTSTPAEMLGLKGVKGTLESGGDADLVVLDEVDGGEEEEGGKKLVVEQVWKFGVKVFDREDDEEEGTGRIC
jgi:N-acetylglucosamine-6-phosphate deacetylase